MKRVFVSGALITAFLCAIAFSVAPQLHERIHPDASRANHECVVTLISSGNYDQAASAPLVAAVSPGQFAEIAVHLTPEWVPCLFSVACPLEHAPPFLLLNR